MPELASSTESAQAKSFYARLGGKLGVPQIRSEAELASLVEKRLPASAIQSLVRGGLSDDEIYLLVVTRRTLTHRVASRQPLSQHESDRAVRVARITSMAEQIFGDPKRAWRWLRKPKRRFGGKSPLAMLTTEAGAHLVEEMIIQLEYGMAA